MENSFPILFVVGVVIIVGIAFLLKSFAKIVLALVAIVILFNMGFIWGVDDLNEKLHLDKILKNNYNEQIMDTLDTFDKKREETAVIDTTALKEVVEEQVKEGVDVVKENIEKIDKDKIIADLQSKLNK